MTARKFLYALFITVFSFHLNAQWLSAPSLPGPARWKASSFVLGNNMYVVGGIDASGNRLSDVWQYNNSTRIWMPMDNFPGTPRCSAVGFSIGTKGYISMGDAGNDQFLSDMWEYDEAGDSWTKKTSLYSPYAARECIVFTIGTRAYIGFGESWDYGPVNSIELLPYLLVYDTQTDSWNFSLAIQDMSGPRKMPIAVTINNKAYVGLGGNINQDTANASLWEFNPADTSWTRKADFPTAFTFGASAFSLNSKLYVVGGTSPVNYNMCKQFYEYDPSTNTWTLLQEFEGGYITEACAAVIGTKAFVGTGFNSSLAPSTKLWELASVKLPSTTGLASHSGANPGSLKLFPNPASDNISVSSSTTKILQVELYDVKGTRVLSETGNFDTIPVSGLSNGIYTVKISSADGNLTRIKFIKTN